VKENTKQTALVMGEDMLLPQEILKLTETMVGLCPIRNVSAKFVQQLKDFMQNIAREVATVRTNIGVKDGLTNEVSLAEVKRERKDPVVQALLRNFTYITESQLKKFMGFVWEKYQRAQIQAGEAVGAVAA